MTYTDQQMNRIIASMERGVHGSFARALAEAFMLADSTNQEIIIKGFESLFDRVARFHGIDLER